MKIIRIITSGIIVLSVVFTCLFGFKKINEEKPIEDKPEYKGIITLWQIDTFEGGRGSRKQFLLDVARDFEKQNNGIIVMVLNHTVYSAEENFKNGIYPDMVSYGNGLNVEPFGEISVKKEFEGGKIGDKTYAVPWCRGGYVLISNPELVSEIPDEIDSLLVSQGEYTMPLTALCLEGIKTNKIETLKPMDAYVKFTSGKIPYFLGTQRDVIRLSNRGMRVNLRPLEKFNDLYQYVSVSSDSELKRFYSERFIEYLISDNVQEKLKNIGMMSTFIDVSYEDDMQKMQKLREFSTVSPFTGREIAEEIKNLSYKATCGEKEAVIKIKNMVI